MRFTVTVAHVRGVQVYFRAGLATGDLVYPIVYCPEFFMPQAFTSEVRRQGVGLWVQGLGCRVRVLRFGFRVAVIIHTLKGLYG